MAYLIDSTKSEIAMSRNFVTWLSLSQERVTLSRRSPHLLYYLAICGETYMHILSNYDHVYVAFVFTIDIDMFLELGF